MNDEQIKAAIHATVAKAILDGLDTEARDELLQQSIAKVIGGYDFRRAVEQVVADKAASAAAELVETAEWEGRIKAAINRGFSTYARNLEKAVGKVLTLAMHGKESEPGSYSSVRAADILKCWPKEDPQ